MGVLFFLFALSYMVGIFFSNLVVPLSIFIGGIMGSFIVFILFIFKNS